MKRVFDCALVLLTAPIWGLVVLTVAALVRLRLGSPVLFRQTRAGLGGKRFLIIKFRSMNDAKDASGKLLPDAERLTPLGKWLRATSLDELPELFNVLAGDMSLVGPRPLLERYLDRYSPRQSRRHEVRPGITGLAQVMGRNALTWEQKFEWDVRYVETQGFWLDIKILFLTLWRVVARSDINASNVVTMPEFLPLAKSGENQQDPQLNPASAPARKALPPT